eukprot:tig00000042_g15423.t1
MNNEFRAKLQADHEKWNTLPSMQKVQLYYPGVTLAASEKRSVAFPKMVYIGLFGRRGFGKSSFMESALHVFKNLDFSQFFRSGPSDESFTQKRDVAEISPCFCLVDHPGMLNMGDEWVRGVLEEVEEQPADMIARSIHKLADAVKGKRVRLNLHGCIVFWDAESDDYDRLRPLCDALFDLTGERPVVCMTKIDKVAPEHTRDMLDNIRRITRCPVFGIANYTYASSQDDPTMNQRIADVCSVALRIADKNIVNSVLRRVGGCSIA